ncbi:hypothetical protein IW140_005226 [Coemansia sp. RSA 1813]|nr:hypothetical protein EV179_003220 [Coemansia sp. RSA 487]KAJ2565641.1 hypothetical protein IW140_005226 [Coemansia sp. RSA 1813]
MDEQVYELSSGEIVQYPSFEYQTLIYHVSDFEFVSKDMYPPPMRDTPVMVQLVKMESVDNINDIVQDYLQNRRECNYPSMMVLHDNTCDVYILGQHFLNHYGIHPIEEGDEISMDFWIARFRYHKSMIAHAITDWAVQDYHQMIEIMSERDDIPTESVGRVDGGTIVGSAEWSCDDYECPDCV